MPRKHPGRYYVWTAADYIPVFEKPSTTLSGDTSLPQKNVWTETLQNDSGDKSAFSLQLEFNAEAIYHYPLLQELERALRYSLVRCPGLQVKENPRTPAILCITCDVETLEKRAEAIRSSEGVQEHASIPHISPDPHVFSSSLTPYQACFLLLDWIFSIPCSRFSQPYTILNGESLLHASLALGAVLSIRCYLRPLACSASNDGFQPCASQRGKLFSFTGLFRDPSADLAMIAASTSPWAAYGCGLEAFTRSGTAVVFVLLLITNFLKVYLPHLPVLRTTVVKDVLHSLFPTLCSAIVLAWYFISISPRRRELFYTFSETPSPAPLVGSRVHNLRSPSHAARTLVCSLARKRDLSYRLSSHLEVLVSSIPRSNGIHLRNALPSSLPDPRTRPLGSNQYFLRLLRDIVSVAAHCVGLGLIGATVFVVARMLDHPFAVLRSFDAAFSGTCATPSSGGFSWTHDIFRMPPPYPLMMRSRYLLQSGLKGVLMSWLLTAPCRDSDNYTSFLFPHLIFQSLSITILSLAWSPLDPSTRVLFQWIASSYPCFAWVGSPALPVPSSIVVPRRPLSFSPRPFTDFECATIIGLTWRHFRRVIRHKNPPVIKECRSSAYRMVSDAFLSVTWVIGCLWNPYLPLILIVATLLNESPWRATVTNGMVMDVATLLMDPPVRLCHCKGPLERSLVTDHNCITPRHPWLWHDVETGLLSISIIGLFLSLLTLLPPTSYVLVPWVTACFSVFVFRKVAATQTPISLELDTFLTDTPSVTMPSQPLHLENTGDARLSPSRLPLDSERLREAAELLISQPGASLTTLSVAAAHQASSPVAPTSQKTDKNIDDNKDLFFLNRFLGTWRLLKDRSDSMESVSKALGVSWAIRRAVEQFTPSCRYERLGATTLRITTLLPMKQTRSVNLYLDNKEHHDQDGDLGAWATITERQSGSDVLVSYRRRRSDGIHLTETRQIRITDSADTDSRNFSTDILWYFVEVRLSNNPNGPVIASSNRYFQRVDGPPPNVQLPTANKVTEDPLNCKKLVNGTIDVRGITTENVSVHSTAIVPLIQSLDELPVLCLSEHTIPKPRLAISTSTRSNPLTYSGQSKPAFYRNIMSHHDNRPDNYVETVCTSVVCTSTTRRCVIGGKADQSDFATTPLSSGQDKMSLDNKACIPHQLSTQVTTSLDQHHLVSSPSTDLSKPLSVIDPFIIPLRRLVHLDNDDIFQLTDALHTARRCAQEVSQLCSPVTDPNTIIGSPRTSEALVDLPVCDTSLSWESQIRTETLQIDRLTVPNQPSVGRASVSFKCGLSVPEILEHLFNPAWLKTVDSAIDKAFSMYSPSPDTMIAYQSYYGGMGVAGRDFVYLGVRSLSNHGKSGTIGVVSLNCPSVEVKHRHKFSKGYVRGSLLRCGFHVKCLDDEDGEGNTTVRLCYLTQVDAKASTLPKWLLNLLQVAQLRRVVQIKNHLLLETEKSEATYSNPQ